MVLHLLKVIGYMLQILYSLFDTLEDRRFQSSYQAIETNEAELQTPLVTLNR